MTKIKYERLKSTDAADILYLKQCAQRPEIKRFISESENYYDFVTKIPGEFYYKILYEGKIVGGLHLEIKNKECYPAIWVLPEYQGKGIAKKCISDLINGVFSKDFKTIVAGIENENEKSLNLFKSLGFKKQDEQDEISIVTFEL